MIPLSFLSRTNAKQGDEKSYLKRGGCSRRLVHVEYMFLLGNNQDMLVNSLFHLKHIWWFQTLLLFSIIYGIILPIDFHIFQDG